MKKALYIIFQCVIALPIMLVVTIICALMAIIFASIFGDSFWGWWPAKIWGRLFCRVFLIPVSIEGEEKVDANEACIFVANHQSLFDILSMLGFINHKFKWMMKKELARIPLVGYACKCCGFIYINRTGKNSIAESMSKADATLRQHKSLAIFAEGTRTRDGHVGTFKRGAFKLASELGMPIVPISINGCYEVMSRDSKLVTRHPIRLVVHEPIIPQGNTPEEMERLRKATYDAIVSGLDAQYIS